MLGQEDCWECLLTARGRDTPSPSHPRGADSGHPSPLCSLHQRVLMAAPEQSRAKDRPAGNPQLGCPFPQAVGTHCTASTEALLLVQPGYRPRRPTHQTVSGGQGLPLRFFVSLRPTADLQTSKARMSLDFGQRRLAVCVHT